LSGPIWALVKGFINTIKELLALQNESARHPSLKLRSSERYFCRVIHLSLVGWGLGGGFD